MNAHPEITVTMATDWLIVYCGPGALGLDVQLAKVRFRESLLIAPPSIYPFANEAVNLSISGGVLDKSAFPCHRSIDQGNSGDHDSLGWSLACTHW